jgi:hypothetical protein
MYNDITEEYLTALAKKVYDKLPVKPEPDKEDNKALEEGELPLPADKDVEFYHILSTRMLYELYDPLIGTYEYPQEAYIDQEWIFQFLSECVEEGNNKEEEKRIRANITPKIIAHAMEYPLAYIGSPFNDTGKVSLDMYKETLDAFSGDASSALFHISEIGYIWCNSNYVGECCVHIAQLMYIAEACHIDLKKALDEYVGKRTLEF